MSRPRVTAGGTPHARAALDSATGWTVTVDDPGTPAPLTGFSWRVGHALDRRDTVVEQLGRALDAHGWAAEGWPAADPVPHEFTLTLTRNDVGRRVDEAAAVLAAAGLDYHQAHVPYLAAVADAIERAGIAVASYFADPDEPRDGAIQLAWPHTLGYAALHVAWREDRGWYYVPFTDPQAALGDHAGELPGSLPRVPEPGRVAAAVAQLVGLDPAAGRPAASTPPAGYAEDPPYVEDWWDASPELERSLAAYAAHPAARGMATSTEG